MHKDDSKQPNSSRDSDGKPVCFGSFNRDAEECLKGCGFLTSCALSAVTVTMAAATGDGIVESSKIDGKRASDILREMATTFEERNAIYGDNYKMVGKLMSVLFPEGVPKEVLHSDQFHLFELKLVKLSRFAISNLTHTDSIHDDGVYSAMIESILSEKGQQA